MKKEGITLVVLFVITCSLFSIPVETDIKHRSMGMVGVADYESSANFFYNPASVLFYNQKSKFIYSTGFADYHGGPDDRIIFKPESYFKTEFISQKISMSINVDFNVKDTPVNKGDGYYYNLNRDVIFNFNATTGYKNFAFGLGFSGGSRMVKNSVSNLLYQTFLGEFEREEDSQFVDIRAGVIYQLSSFSFGLVDEKLFSYTGKQNRLTMKNALDGITGGLYWSQDRYAKRGRLNQWVFDAGFEFANILDTENSTIGSGVEATLQLNREYSISFRTGLTFPVKDFSLVKQCFGVGARIGRMDLGAFASVPLNIFEGDDDEVSVGINFSVIN